MKKIYLFSLFSILFLSIFVMNTKVYAYESDTILNNSMNNVESSNFSSISYYQEALNFLNNKNTAKVSNHDGYKNYYTVEACDYVTTMYDKIIYYSSEPVYINGNSSVTLVRDYYINGNLMVGYTSQTVKAAESVVKNFVGINCSSSDLHDETLGNYYLSYQYYFYTNGILPCDSYVTYNVDSSRERVRLALYADVIVGSVKIHKYTKRIVNYYLDNTYEMQSAIYIFCNISERIQYDF